MSNDFELFPDSADDGSAIDADIALITAFLSRELSSVQIAAVHDRLEYDAAFREKVQPLIEGWTFHGTEDARALESARSRVQSATSLTDAEIAAGWKRHTAAPPPAGTHSPSVAAALPVDPSFPRTREPSVVVEGRWVPAFAGMTTLKLQKRRSMMRIAATIAVIALPIAVSAQLLISAAKRSGMPDRSLAPDVLRGEPNAVVQRELVLREPDVVQRARDPKYDSLARHIEVVTMNISVTPPDFPPVDPGGLISALLFVSPGLRVGPHSIRRDGSYFSGAARITKDDMLRVVDVLDRGGFLAAADTYYSERTDKPLGPPPAAKHIRDHLALGQKSPELRLNFFDADYYTEYIILPSRDKQIVPLLTELRRAVADSAAKALLTQLLATAALKVPAK